MNMGNECKHIADLVPLTNDLQNEHFNSNGALRTLNLL